MNRNWTASLVMFVACSVGLQSGAAAQTRWTVDQRSSLAWWQVSPHLNHLWASTCPEEPTWRPGEGRSAGWSLGGLAAPKQGYANVRDTSKVPLYPRPRALPVCSEGMEGHVEAPDTVTWKGVSGEIIVYADALITGHEQRDLFTHETILQTDRYPDIKFTIDSVVNVSRSGDTLVGTAMGMFRLRELPTRMNAAIRAWPEAGGLRVTGKLHAPAVWLTREFGLSRFALGLGVTTAIWQDFFMGVDVVLRRQGAGGR